MSDASETLKKELLLASEEYREEIKAGLKSVADSLGETGRNALIIGGSVLVGYLLYRAFSSDNEDEEPTVKIQKRPITDSEIYMQQPKSPRVIDKVAEKIMDTATVFLLEIAKQKLAEFLEQNQQNRKNEQANSEQVQEAAAER